MTLEKQPGRSVAESGIDTEDKVGMFTEPNCCAMANVVRVPAGSQ